MIAVYDLLALGAAACWAVGGMLSVTPVRHLGAFAFTRWRMSLVALMLWSIVAVMGSWNSLSWNVAGTLALSGLIGIFVGDTALFGAVHRLGPRRASVLFATHAAFSALFGFLFLGERMGMQAAIGGAVTMAGVMSAIVLGRTANESHAWEVDHGSLRLGIVLGLVAAACQAISTLIAKPVMSASASGLSVDPIAASALRVTVACAAHYVLVGLRVKIAQPLNSINARIMGQTALNGFIGMGVGMSFILMALRHGDVGTVAILSSVSPVVVLPLMWWHTGRAPALGAWIGAALTVCGTGLILMR